MICPYCGKDVVTVGVHDDEGNYHGELGCEYESNPWSGLSYGLVHWDGWNECILSSDEDVMGGVLFDTAEEAAEALQRLNAAKKLADALAEIKQKFDLDGTAKLLIAHEDASILPYAAAIMQLLSDIMNEKPENK